MTSAFQKYTNLLYIKIEERREKREERREKRVERTEKREQRKTFYCVLIQCV